MNWRPLARFIGAPGKREEAPNRSASSFATMVANALSDLSPSPTRAFGRFELHALLGKSAATMVWLALDRQAGQDVMLTMPREAPADADRLARWTERARHAARLDHPNLAATTEIGVHDHWPYVAVERAARLTLQEWLALHPAPVPADVAGWLVASLSGLAYAHEAGAAHGDLQLHQVLIDERGVVCVMGLGVAELAGAPVRGQGGRGMAMDPALLRDQRAAAERDVVVCGVLLHHMLCGEAPLGIADTAGVLARMAPSGREVLRLPWTTPAPVAEALRAIANRATSPQERLRYRSARTLLGALSGWLAVDAGEGGGPIALLLDRLHSVGHLPALPGLAARVARVVSLEGQRADEITGQILPDMALSFELLRTLNTAQVQGTQIAGNGTVLTLRRAVALIGVNGVRKAANALRPWPGLLTDEGAAQLRKTMDRVRLAGHLAQVLRPPGYDPEVVYLITVMQNLGRLMIRYHFADEAEQVAQLMGSKATAEAASSTAESTPASSQKAATASGEKLSAGDTPGMSEDAAAFAVLGVDVAAFGFAVARQWGLGDEVLHMIRRLPIDTPVRKPDNDGELLRSLASAANEVVDAVTELPARRVGAALERIAERYARLFQTTPRMLKDALQEARDDQRRGPSPAASPRPAIVPGEPAARAE